jgi:hypothetical protein
VVEPKVPPRSPDLNSCLFVWGHLKQLVYSQPINSTEELTGRVVAVVSSVQIREDREIFSKVRGSMARRPQACITHQGQHFQHFTTLKVKVLCTRTFFQDNSVSVSNFLRGNRFSCVFFLSFRFLSSLASTTGRNEVNFEFFNSQFRPVEIVFKCFGSLRLKIFPPILITPVHTRI